MGSPVDFIDVELDLNPDDSDESEWLYLSAYWRTNFDLLLDMSSFLNQLI